MIKLIASDIDGTLVYGNDDIGELTYQQIQKLEKENIEFILCTGRNYFEVKPLLQKYDLHCGAICVNGSVVFNKDKQVEFSYSLTKELVDPIIPVILSEGCFSMFHTEDAVYCPMKKEQIDEIYKEYMSHITDEKQIKKYTHNKEAYIDQLNHGISLEEILKKNILKIEMMFLSDEMYDRLFEKIQNENLYMCTSNYASNLEITNANATKSQGLMRYCQLKNIEMKEVVVFGDSDNDLNMFQTFENSFAVENCSDNIRKAAKYFTSSNEMDGVGKGIQIILENNKRELQSM